MNINITHFLNLTPKVESLLTRLINLGERIVATNEETTAELVAVKGSLDTLTTAVDTLIAKAQTADVTNPALQAAVDDVKVGLQSLTDKVNAAVTPVAPV